MKSNLTDQRTNPRRLFIEIPLLGGLYAIYTYARNINESSPEYAYKHALSIIRIEKYFHIYWERKIHHYFLNFDWVIICANYFYGSLHFIATLFTLIYIFTHDPQRYSKVRTTIVVTTLIALIGFIIFPLMPPRLLPESFGFVDTLVKYPTIWSFNQKDFAEISNQYAAMPSLHIAWSTWCLIALYPYMKNKILKTLLVLYPCITFFVIIVTSNHYFLDAIGGLFVLYIGYIIASIIEKIKEKRHTNELELLNE